MARYRTGPRLFDARGGHPVPVHHVVDVCGTANFDLIAHLQPRDAIRGSDARSLHTEPVVQREKEFPLIGPYRTHLGTNRLG